MRRPPPKHYSLGPQPVDVIDAWGLNYKLGNALKYIARCAHKGQKIKDLKKAIHYLEMEIEKELEPEEEERIKKEFDSFCFGKVCDGCRYEKALGLCIERYKEDREQNAL